MNGSIPTAETIALSSIDPGRICASNKGGGRVLSLTEDEWSLIRSVELNVFVDDGEGYIDLGYDNTFEFDGNAYLVTGLQQYITSSPTYKATTEAG